MTKSHIKQAALLVAALFSVTMTSAQELPVLAPDKAVKTGVLPNGTQYYLIANPTFKGLADFALVQKTGTENIADAESHKAVSVARDALAELPRTGGASVQEFFTSHGVAPGKDGFVKVTDDATQFRFSNVLLSKPEVLDSTLLVILDMVDRISTTDDEFIRRWYSPSDQAIIVSGDIDPDAVAGKLKLMSYMTPAVESSARKDYEWKGWETAVYRNEKPSGADLASFTVKWASARTPRESMNTVQPVIYELFLEELGMTAKEQISEVLHKRSVPFAEVSYSYETSLHSSGDESFSVSVSLAEKDFAAAVEAVAQVMGNIDAGNTDVHDFVRVKQICTDLIAEKSFKQVIPNSENIDRCVAAFLYNGSLATLNTKVSFLTGRALPDSSELRIFNSIASALLDTDKNVSMTYSAAVGDDSVRDIFTRSWGPAANPSSSKHYTVADIPAYFYEGPKLKIREKADHMSGGLEWTFSNGIKVVYRRMPTGGRLYYNLALNGGYGAAGDFNKGEGIYVSDYFMLSDICNIPANEFLGVLAKEGMSMDVYVGLNNMMISGSVNEEKTDLMMNALIAAMNGRKRNGEAVRYYESGEYLRNELRKGTHEEMDAKINEIMCPDYKHISHKMLSSRPEDLSDRVEKMFLNMTTKINDGVLVILGDVDAETLKKQLTNYVGGFTASDLLYNRPLVRYQPTAGWSTYTVEGDRNSVDVVLSAPLALTIDNFMTVEVAAMMLKKYLADAVIDSEMYLEIDHECKIYPSERVNFHISLNEISPDGFSSGIVHTDNLDALAIVRNVLSEMADKEISNEDVEVFKAQLKNRMDQEMKEPFYWLNVISRRHLAGKDFTSNHAARIKAVNADKVKKLLSSLNEGTKVEYVVSKK